MGLFVWAGLAWARQSRMASLTWLGLWQDGCIRFPCCCTSSISLAWTCSHSGGWVPVSKRRHHECANPWLHHICPCPIGQTNCMVKSRSSGWRNRSHPLRGKVAKSFCDRVQITRAGIWLLLSSSPLLHGYVSGQLCSPFHHPSAYIYGTVY